MERYGRDLVERKRFGSMCGKVVQEEVSYPF